MRLAVDQRHAEINQGITGKHTLRQLVADTLLHRRNELPRHRSTDYALGELEPGAAFQRLDLHHADRVLTMSAGLLDESALRRDGTDEGLAERGTHRLHLDLDVPVLPERSEQLL